MLDVAGWAIDHDSTGGDDDCFFFFMFLPYLARLVVRVVVLALCTSLMNGR